MNRDRIENGKAHTQFWNDVPSVSPRIRIAN